MYVSALMLCRNPFVGECASAETSLIVIRGLRHSRQTIPEDEQCHSHDAGDDRSQKSGCACRHLCSARVAGAQLVGNPARVLPFARAEIIKPCERDRTLLQVQFSEQGCDMQPAARCMEQPIAPNCTAGRPSP